MPNLSESLAELAFDLQNRVDAGETLPDDLQEMLDDYNQQAKFESMFDTVEDGYGL